MSLREDPDHREWLDAECRRLLSFGARVVHPLGGAVWLDDHGSPEPQRGIQTWITARTVHVNSLGVLLGVPGSAELAAGALAGLVGPLHDAEHGGWFTAATSDGSPDRAAGKSAYHHAFVMLAASSGVLAGIDGAGALLEEAEAVFEERFWDDAAGGCVDRWDDAWQRADDYRGLNGTMHAVEAMLAVADVTGRTTWRERAARVADLVVDLAHAHDGRLPEHFDASWTPDLELNRDRPADPFKPFGATIGHALEWSRLLLDLEAALGPAAPASLLPTAVLLFDRAVADGWASDGAPGFVYTTDWDGRPVVRARMHWVAAEAVAAAAALHQRTGEASYDDHYRTWWHYIANHVIDLLAGSWHHELDPDNRPAASVWPGKPDLYHAVQATLLPRLPLAPSLASAVRAGALRAM